MILMSNVRRTSIFASMVLSSLLIYSFPAQSQQRACVITDEGATVCGKPTKQPKNTNSHSEQRKLINGYVFLLKGCRRSDTTIKCNLSITRESTEDNFGINASQLTIVDSVGKSYNGSSVEMGGKIGTSVSLRISPGINYVTDITFENIPENITQAPVLKLPVFANNGGNDIDFRNVPFPN